MRKQRDTGLETSRTLSSEISRFDLIKKSSRSTALLAPMEETVPIPGPFGGSQTPQLTALRRNKAAYEFLVLHKSKVLQLACLSPPGHLHWKCLVPRTYKTF